MFNASSLWEKCLNELKYQVNDSDYQMWIRVLSNPTIKDNSLTLFVPNSHILDKINNDYLMLIKEVAIAQGSGDIVSVNVAVEASKTNDDFYGMDANLHQQNFSSNNQTSQYMDRTGGQIGTPLPNSSAKSSANSLNYINPEFTFDTFVTGKSNNLAYKACYEVSKKNPQTRHNPLFIYGPSGLGKTHLMHSVAHRYLKSNRNFYYFTSDKFINQVVHSIRADKIDELKKKIKKVDLLIIDDIHVIAGKAKTSTEFLSLFSEFTKGDKQIILASDRHPVQLTEFDDHIRSRFSWGLAVAIEAPEFDTRVQILQKKAELMGVNLPKECALFIAQTVVSDVRRLEGALNSVVANANLTGSAITIETAQYALKDIIALRMQTVNMDNIRKVVAEYYEVTVKDLMGKKRTRSIARPRQIAMSLSRELTGDSYPDIGQSFGGRDHSTVMHACNKIDELRKDDPVLDKEYKALAMMLQAG